MSKIKENLKYTSERLTNNTVAGYTLKDYGDSDLIGLYKSYDVFFAHLKATERLGRIEDMITLRPKEDWDEDFGDCLWWDSNEIVEPPYVGSPLDTDWDDTMKFFIEIPNPIKKGGYRMKPEKIDNVNKPSHYQGRFGMESIDALRNFMTPEQLKGFYLGNALKYQLRFQKKNGLEDLKKARKNLDWLIEEMEHEE